MGELKPCPFCGASGTDDEWPGLHIMQRPLVDGSQPWFAECHSCDTYKGPGWRTPEAAYAAWNTRADAPEIAQLRAEVERLRWALRWSAGAAINTLIAEGRDPGWSEGSGIGVALSALGCHSLTLDDDVRAALGEGE